MATVPVVIQPSRGVQIVGTVALAALTAAVVVVRAGATGVEGAVIAVLAVAVGLGAGIELWRGRIELDAGTVRVVTLWRQTTMARSDVVAVRDPRRLRRGAALVVTGDAGPTLPWRSVMLPAFVGAGRASAGLDLPRFGWSAADQERLGSLVARHGRPAP